MQRDRQPAFPKQGERGLIERIEDQRPSILKSPARSCNRTIMRANSSRASGSGRRAAVVAVTASVVALTAFVRGVAVATPPGGQAPSLDVTTQADWILLYAEDFSTPLNGAVVPWVWDGYSKPFDTIMDDSGLWYQNDYGPDWHTAVSSFTTYRKEFPVGQDDWLTASLSARDWDRNGVIEAPPSISTQAQGGEHVAVLDVPDHTGGAIFRPTNKLPSQYRIEYKLKTIDFGGKRSGAIEYDGRINGYRTEGCKTQHPWGEGSNTPGWTGNASVPLCEWQDVREGPLRLQRIPLPGHRGLRRSGAAEQPLLALPPKGADGRLFPAPGPGRQRHRWPGLQLQH